MILFDSIFALPEPARLNKPFPKSFFTRHDFKLSAAEKRLVNEPFVPLESVWIGSLKPTAGNVPEYRRATEESSTPAEGRMDYREVQYFRIKLREGDYDSRAEVLAKLYHRYLPYPVVLLLHGDLYYHLSAATKEIPATAGQACTHLQIFRSPEVSLAKPEGAQLTFQQSLAFPRLNTLNLKTTYDGYLAAISQLGWQTATGLATTVADPHRQYARLEQLRQLERQRDRLTTQLRKSKRMTERVELQTELSEVIRSLKKLKNNRPTHE